MASLVIFRAPPPAKMQHVTYKMEHVWSVNLAYIAVTVTCRVPPTVITTHVTNRMEHAIHVNLVGLEYSAKQVILLIIHVIKMYITCFFVYVCYKEQNISNFILQILFVKQVSLVLIESISKICILTYAHVDYLTLKDDCTWRHVLGPFWSPLLSLFHNLISLLFNIV